MTLLAGVLSVAAQQVPPGFEVDILATNLNAATATVPLPDGRILLAEQTGRVLVWKRGRVLPEPAVNVPVTDYWERGLIGLTVHPSFPQPPFVYGCYVTDEPFVHHVIARWRMDGDRIDLTSETVLLRGDDQDQFGGFKKAGHQGGTIAFGHDGMLYVSIGEQTAKSPSQDLHALQGSILRIRPDGTIPEDNPFRDRTEGKYGSIYAMGVRNSFGLAMQPLADGGRIFFTDVGESRYEEVNELVAGGNYGWPKYEGPSPGEDEGMIAPLHSYTPAVGKSICGGVFYPRHPKFGAGNFPEPWRGQFFFVDWGSHWIKFIDPDAPEKSKHFSSGWDSPVAIALTVEGALLVLNRGTIWRDGKNFEERSGSLLRIRYTGRDLARETSPDNIQEVEMALGFPSRYAQLPAKLSELPIHGWLAAQIRGTNLARIAVRDGEPVPYELNQSPWLPGVRVRRWLALPDGAALGFSVSNEWSMPVGTVVIHHYETAPDTSAKNPKAQGAGAVRPLETRFLARGNSAFYGVSYRWSADNDEGRLVEDPDWILLEDGSGWPLSAPEPYLSAPEHSLSFAPHLNTRQWNRPGASNPIMAWHESGRLGGLPFQANPEAWPRLVSRGQRSEGDGLGALVRSYMDVHCAPCHQPGVNARGQFDARWQTSLEQTGMVHGMPAAGDLGVDGARILVPGRPERSLLYLRLKHPGIYRMPPVQYHSHPSPILVALEAWIRDMP